MSSSLIVWVGSESKISFFIVDTQKINKWKRQDHVKIEAENKVMQPKST